MYLRHLLALLPLAGGALAAAGPAPKLEGLKQATIYAPKKFILELNKGQSVADVSAEIKAKGGKVLRTFESDIFTGLSVESGTDNVDTLGSLAAVSQAWQAGRFTLDLPVAPQTFSDDATAANYSVHASTGVDKAHAAGITGKGAIVAIVDTGVDYNHPALGGGYGPGFKVDGGYDLVGDGEWPYTEKVPDNDPLDILGHGTHVSGIIAGKTDSFTGVAPDATLRMYKVFAQYDATDEDTLIEAFLLAYNDGADVITSSVGGASGWSDGPWATVASRLVEQGVVVTIAAGNSGQAGVFYGSDGSLGKNVIGVASTDPSIHAAVPFKANFTLDGVVNATQLGYLPAVVVSSQGYQENTLDIPVGTPIYPISFDTSDAAQVCTALPTDTPDLSKVVVLARRGGCTFAQKQSYLEQYGAQYILFYDNDQAIVSPSTTDSKSQTALIEAAAGEAIINTVKAGGSVTTDFTYYADWFVGVFNSAGGIPSYYTSWGGTYELNVKPDVAAPGANILSTYLNNSWATLSGTSMATPYVAGVAALYVSAFGGRAKNGNSIGKKISNRIVSSGRALPWQVGSPSGPPVDYGYWAPVAQVGTGLLDAWRVLNATTQLAFDPIALNDTGHFSRYHKVDITNTAATPVTYKFTLQPAGGLDAQSSYADFLASSSELVPKPYVPQVSFPSGAFTVQPGETRTAQFNFQPPTGYDESLLPVYSGKVLISGSNGDELSMPYLGAAFDLKKQLRGKIFPDTTPYQIGGPNQDDISVYHSYDFNLSLSAQDFPKVYTEFKWGTKELRWDIYEAGWKEYRWQYPPAGGEDGYVGSATYFAGSNSYYYFDPATLDKEDVLPLPVYDLFRTTTVNFYEQGFWWFGKLANGSYIAPGNYTFRFAALTPFSDPAHSDSWDIWNTPEITILPYTP